MAEAEQRDDPTADDAANAVLITGVHRSGTSLTMRILDSLGLQLGPRDRLMAPQPDNPDGFFENLDIVALNERLLDLGAGAWDVVPAPPDPSLLDRWQSACGDRARAVCGAIAMHGGGKQRWGWKDPRGCLTLPFWSALLPEARVVVCIRDPMCIARSLRKRNKVSRRFSLRLCQDYLLRLEKSLASASHPVLVVSMERLCAAPTVQIERLARFAGLPLDRVDEAAAAVKPDFIHHQATDILRQPSLCAEYPALVETYGRLLERAGHSSEPEFS